MALSSAPTNIKPPPNSRFLLLLPSDPFPQTPILTKIASPREAAMAEQENFPPRLTRAALKRASAIETSSSQPLAKKNRVALSDLPNLTNAGSTRTGAVQSKPNRTRAKKKEQDLKLGESSCKEIEVANVSIPVADTIDKEIEVEDPQMVAPYASDIYQYLRSMEVESKRRPLPNYVEKTQPDITADMRAVLIDWLVDVAEEYKLLPETLYLTTSYIDRYLSCNAINRKRLQLLGVSSMLIASKYEEIHPPNVDDFCGITANTYNKQEVVEMECDLLRSLKYDLGTPTINTFLRRFLKDGHEDSKSSNLVLEFLAYYLAELSLIDYGCIKFLPSIVAASAVFLAKFTIDPTNHSWIKKLEGSTGYKVSELKDCIYALHELQLNKRCCSLGAIRDKYKQDMFKCVSTLVPREEMLRIFFDEPKKESV